MKSKIVYFVIFVSYVSLHAQERPVDLSGKYSYAIVDTPYGDYFGVITLVKKGNSYQGEILDDEGTKYNLRVIRTYGSIIIFKSDIEESKSVFTCEIKGDSIRGTIKVRSDDFNYVLKGKRVE